jgi:AraC-like DNA-binding protein
MRIATQASATASNIQRFRGMTESEARHLLQSPPNGDFAGAMRQVILGRRQRGWISLAQAAKFAGVSVRTVQRRLAATDLVFSDLVEEARVELAVDLLTTTKASLAEIAAETGYSEETNFIRAFRRWTGKTPAEFRQ